MAAIRNLDTEQIFYARFDITIKSGLLNVLERRQG
jgi:hypothetical protein